jgi:diaminopimelate decarboxylase
VTPPGDAWGAELFPDTARARDGRLVIGGCDLVALAQTYGTPLYVYDEAGIRARARALVEALASSYAGRSRVCYAAKAYAAPWLLRLMCNESLGLDVVSGGELHAALAAGVPPERVYFHGNNKDVEELERALDAGVGRIVVDNLEEVSLLSRLAAARATRQAVLLRVAPEVDAHTHPHLRTGGTDTKFGLSIASGEAAEAARVVLAEPTLDLRGIHAHVGSQIFEAETYAEVIDRLFAFAGELRDATGFRLREISPGGGFGVRYTVDDPPSPAGSLVSLVGRRVADAAEDHGFSELPDLTIEPGRLLVASSAVALYRVGSVKRIPGGRTYAAVDGGMADNIRPTAYGAGYSAVLANRVGEPADTEVAIAGKYCEMGDILIQRALLPLPRRGDLVAVATAGAYQLSMASNYNLAPRPAVVVVADGRARLVRRRETYEDLLRHDVIEGPAG